MCYQPESYRKLVINIPHKTKIDSCAAKNGQVVTSQLTSCNNLLQQADIRMHSHGLRQLVDDKSVASCQQVATSLSISSNCNKSVKIRLVATCHLQTCYNLLQQLAASHEDNKFEQSTCNKSVDNLQQTCPQQAVASHANPYLLILC